MKFSGVTFYDPLYELIAIDHKLPLRKAAFDYTNQKSGPIDPIAIIQTEEFIRLSRLKQSGLSWLVFPSATHTRYAHSIGCWKVGLIAETLIKVHDKEKKSLYRWLEEKELRGEFLYSLLLHDIGHGPLDHVIENNKEFINGLQKAGIEKTDQEHRGISLITGKGPLADAWKSKLKNLNSDTQSISELFANVDEKQLNIGEIAFLMTGDPFYLSEFKVDSKKIENLHILKELVCGIFDLDRLDHYARDCYSSGFKNIAPNISGLLSGINLNCHKYLFSWDEIPGNDNDKLKQFLEKSYDIDWVKTANIKKIEGGKTIIVSIGENSLSLTINDKKTKVSSKIDEIKIGELGAKMENGKLNIYEEQKICLTEDGVSYVASLLFNRRQLITTMYQDDRVLSINAMVNWAISCYLSNLSKIDIPSECLNIALMNDDEIMMHISKDDAPDLCKKIINRIKSISPYTVAGEWPYDPKNNNCQNIIADFIEKYESVSNHQDKLPEALTYTEQGFDDKSGIKPGTREDWLNPDKLFLDDGKTKLSDHMKFKNDFEHIQKVSKRSLFWCFASDNTLADTFRKSLQSNLKKCVTHE